MARLVKRTDEHEAYQCLLKAAKKYATSLHWNANNPQVRLAIRVHSATCKTLQAELESLQHMWVMPSLQQATTAAVCQEPRHPTGELCCTGTAAPP